MHACAVCFRFGRRTRLSLGARSSGGYEVVDDEKKPVYDRDMEQGF